MRHSWRNSLTPRPGNSRSPAPRRRQRDKMAGSRDGRAGLVDTRMSHPTASSAAAKMYSSLAQSKYLRRFPSLARQALFLVDGIVTMGDWWVFAALDTTLLHTSYKNWRIHHETS